MARSKWAAVAVVAVITLFAGWYFYSPVYTLQQMKAAAESHDSDGFSAYVDFPALREDMKAEVMAQMMAEAEQDTSGFGGLGIAIGSAMLGPMIDGMISPAGIRAAFVANEAKPDGKRRKGAMGAFQVDEEPVIERRSFSEFAVVSEGDQEGAMIFKRHGLGWKLSGVDLPPDAASSKPEPVITDPEELKPVQNALPHDAYRDM